MENLEKQIKVIQENVITLKDGRKWEIRKKSPTHLLIRHVGMKSSMRIKVAEFNELVEEKDQIIHF
jgi:hypothetical protein